MKQIVVVYICVLMIGSSFLISSIEASASTYAESSTEYHSVYGHVYYRDGPLAGLNTTNAFVEVYNRTGTVATSITDQYGDYTVDGIPEGENYSIKITPIGGVSGGIGVGPSEESIDSGYIIYDYGLFDLESEIRIDAVINFHVPIPLPQPFDVHVNVSYIGGPLGGQVANDARVQIINMNNEIYGTANYGENGTYVIYDVPSVLLIQLEPLEVYYSCSPVYRYDGLFYDCDPYNVIEISWVPNDVYKYSTSYHWKYILEVIPDSNITGIDGQISGYLSSSATIEEDNQTSFFPPPSGPPGSGPSPGIEVYRDVELHYTYHNSSIDNFTATDLELQNTAKISLVLNVILIFVLCMVILIKWSKFPDDIVLPNIKKIRIILKDKFVAILTIISIIVTSIDIIIQLR